MEKQTMQFESKPDESNGGTDNGTSEQISTLPTIENVAELYKIANDNRTDENIIKWKKAYDLYAGKADSEEELESLLKFSHITYGGIATHAVDTPASLERIQDRLASILNEQIEKSTTIDEICNIFDKLKKVEREQKIGMTDTRIAMKNACTKWYKLCATKDDIEKMILKTRTDIRDIVYASKGSVSGIFTGI